MTDGGGVSVTVRPLPAWLDAPRLLGLDAAWTHDGDTWTASGVGRRDAADLAARLRGVGVDGQLLDVEVRPPLNRRLVRQARTDDARRRRDTTPGFLDGRARVDEVGRRSLTPEALAVALGRRVAALAGPDAHVLDATAGCGGNALGFARAGLRVTAVELDPVRADQARHNARVYGVADRLHVVAGDGVAAAAEVDADVLFVDPPWGEASRQACGMDDLPVLAAVLQAGADRFRHVLAKVPASFATASLPGFAAEAWFGEAPGDRHRIKFVLLTRSTTP